MKNLLFVFLIFTVISTSYGQHKVIKINFLDSQNLKYNAAGPVLTRCDAGRNRIITANANTSSVSVIDCESNRITNIPVDGRAIQHLKDESFTIDSKTGNAYLIGKKCLYVVFPENETSKTFYTDKQFEMAAVDENTGNAFLTGRESNSAAFIDIETGEIKYIKYTEFEEPLLNLNQTPPPPIRKVVSANNLKEIIVVDGYTSDLFIIDSQTGKLIKSRNLGTVNGARWHYAGFNQITDCLYLVVETAERKVVQAVKIDIRNGNDLIVPLPGLTEGVGITYNKKTDEVYIPYDNHPSVHVVDFSKNGELTEIKIPQYGNDASAIDEKNNLLYISSWAYGEVEIIDLVKRKFIKRIPDLGIIPHMFNMEFNPNNSTLYIPIGADAVNGVFGAAVTTVNTKNFETGKIHLGWSPIDLIPKPGSNDFLVFNSEDELAVVQPEGIYTLHKLPFNYPNRALSNNTGNIYLSYGPHQSYWPVVYIWGAKDGIMQIDPVTLEISDRRIPRLAQDMFIDENGALYALQNSWGKEKQFLVVLEDEVREFNAGRRLEIEDEIERETVQRILKYDEKEKLIYLVKTGEKDSDNGLLQIIDKENKKLIKRIEVGLTPTDLAFDENFIYVTNFDSNSLTKIEKRNYSVETLTAGAKPLKICFAGEIPFVINHNENSLQKMSGDFRKYFLPQDGMPDNIRFINNKFILTSHSEDNLYIFSFDPRDEKFELIHLEKYPYGDTSFDNNNSAFYLRGQYGDALFEITKIKPGNDGKIWITDFISGSLFVIK